MKLLSSRLGLPLAATLWLLGFSPVSFAQRAGGRWTLEYEWFSTQLDERFGNAVAGPGDLNFDGYDDLLIGAPDPSSNQGVVRAYSGVDGGLLWSWADLGLCRSGESLDGAGDLNGDGRPDVIVGIPECCKTTTLLHDGTPWWTVMSGEDLGVSVAGAGDVNLDGFDDVIVGESRASPFGLHRAGSAYVYSGRDGAILYQFHGFSPGDMLGLAVGGAGDVSGDGIPDLVVGAPMANRNGLAGNGAVYIYSGSTGAVLYQHFGNVNQEYLGHRVTGAGDLDKDGYADLLVATTGASYTGMWSGSVYSYSGRTGSVFYRLDGQQPRDLFGWAIDSLKDVDLDGVRDVAVAAREDYSPQSLGRVEIYSGATGTLLDVIPGSGGSFGWDMANAGDVDRDRFPDLIVGAISFGSGGAAYLFSFDPFLYAGATEISAGSGLPVEVRMLFPASEALQRYALLLSGAGTGPTTLGGIEVPLGAGPLLNQMLAGQAPPNVQGAYSSLNANAQANARIDSHPQLAALVGRTFHMAAVSYDAATLQGRLSSIAWPLAVIP